MSDITKAVDSIATGVEDLLVSTSPSEAGGKTATYEVPDNLCQRCQNLDIIGILADYRKAKDSFGEYIVTDLGSIESMKRSNCPLCQFFSSMTLEKQTDDTCDCILDQKLHTFPSFKTTSLQLRAMIVGHAYLGQEVDRGVRQKVSGLQNQVMLGLAPKISSSKESWTTAYHCWYRTGMIAASISSENRSQSAGKKKRWNLQTRQLEAGKISYEILAAWLNVCKNEHEEECAVNSFSKSPCAKVINCKTGEIIRTPQNCEYLALSYVWGRTQELSPGPMKISEGNSAILMMPDSLPLTVSDGMKVVRRLGFQYLWVDKYCIDQEDEVEKMSQILSMDQIYAQCTAVIVAAAGRDSSFGLPGVSTRPRITQPTVTVKGVTLRSTLPNPVYNTRRSIWMTRGWTYQEAVFPKRRLYFTEHQVVFECNEALFTEVFDLPHDVKVQQYQHDDSIFIATDISEEDNPMILRYTLSSHIEAFSSRNLTYEGDALNAFQGIFQRLKRLKSPVHEFRGLPIQNSALSLDRLRGKEKHNTGEESDSEEESDDENESMSDFNPQHLSASGVLASALYWYHVPVSTIDMSTIKRRLIFPSWTWLGWTKQVTWSLDLPIDEINDIEIDVEDKEGRLWPWDSWENAGEIMRNQESLSGRLRIRGWLVEAKISSAMFGSCRKFFVSRKGQRDVELYASLETASASSLPRDDKEKGVSDFYQQLLDENIIWELLSLGPSEPLMLLKDEGNDQFSRWGTTEKVLPVHDRSGRKKGRSHRRRGELWLI
ncbi:hypothetical protein G7Y89_g333 [Cudoniella acicularis]|uniref:Heterokaryon incompatibility domain-containing protein n=1 Tax=Cudoniella acicularis TaxID=354080 RepID=A0A8H4RZC1_9HELO|nr:hypothetical protein G7Y89_g333 [Cudoniella acicularis]